MRFLASLAIGLGFCLTACSQLGGGSVETVRLALAGNSLNVDESRLQRGIAYARAEIGKSKLLIGRDPVSDSGRETWYTAGNQVLIFEHGLLRGTAGMPLDLIDIRYPKPHPLTTGLQGLVLPVEFLREVDRSGQYQEVSRYRLEDCGLEGLKTWGVDGPVRCLREILVDSNVPNPLPGNTYWISESTGEWRQSRQWIDSAWPVLLQPRPGAVAPLVPYKGSAAMEESRSSRLVAPHSMRLSRLLLDYPVPAIRRPVAAWLSRNAELEQRQQKRGVLFDLDQTLQFKEDMAPEVRRRLQYFQAQVAAMPVTGRKPLPVLEPRWLVLNPAHDKVFEGGDQLLRKLRMPTDVLIVGNVPAPCRLAINAPVTVVALLKTCIPGEPLPDAVYMIDPEGAISSVNVALWNRADRFVQPGDLLYLPFPGYANHSGNPDADQDMAQWLATQFDPVDSLQQDHLR